jgi:hypothetical protein
MEGGPESAPFREFRQLYFGSLRFDNITFGQENRKSSFKKIDGSIGDNGLLRETALTRPWAVRWTADIDFKQLLRDFRGRLREMG